MIDFASLPDKAPQYDLRELFAAGMHYGHHKSKWHPRMAQFIHSEKDGVHIVDLEKTAKQLRTAYNYIYQLGTEKRPVILVGTKRQARELIKSLAAPAGLLYITSRWLGGLMTNWIQVKKSIQHMLDTETKLAEDGFKGRTKYEVLQIEKEVARAKRFFDGVRSLTDLPAAIIVIDPGKEKIVVAEANRMDVPVVALVDTNTNPDDLAIAIPGNDDAAKSIELFVTQMAAAYQAGRADAGKAKETTAAPVAVKAATPEVESVAPAAPAQPAEKTEVKAEVKKEKKTTTKAEKKPVKTVKKGTKKAATKTKSAAKKKE